MPFSHAKKLNSLIFKLTWHSSNFLENFLKILRNLFNYHLKIHRNNYLKSNACSLFHNPCG